MALIRYQVYCTEEATTKDWFLKDTEPSPESCPTDNAHHIDPSRTAITALDSPMDVVTVFEKNDKTLAIASAVCTTDPDSGIATCLVKVPGTPGSADGRWVDSGTAWFDAPHRDDVIQVHITDEDDMLGAGAGFLVRSYTDIDVPGEQQGWRVPRCKPKIHVDSLAGYGFIPAGFWLKVTGFKGSTPVASDHVDVPHSKFIDIFQTYYNGLACRLSTTGTLPAPLLPSTTYYLAQVDGHGFKLATSLLDAVNGNSIVLSDAGTGSHTIIVQDSLYVNLKWGYTG